MKIVLWIILISEIIDHIQGALRIIGGEEAPDGEYPWFYNAGSGCGGSLIAPDLVLSAAHCASVFNTTQFKPIIHPHYEFKDEYVTHDIMIIRLSEPIENVKIVALDTGSVSSSYNDKTSLWALGM